MNREVLDSLGEAALRRMARQVGLRGASVLAPDLLRVGLGAYLSAQRAAEAADPAPMETEGAPLDDDGAGGGAAEAALPPALRTETMARVLEGQGRAVEAARVRASLEGAGASARASSEGPPGSEGAGASARATGERSVRDAPLSEHGWDSLGRQVAVALERAAAGGLVVRYRISGGAAPSNGPDRPRVSLEWALFFSGGGTRTGRVALEKGVAGPGDLAGELPLRRSAEAVAGVAALVERAGGGQGRGGRGRPLARTPVVELPDDDHGAS